MAEKSNKTKTAEEPKKASKKKITEEAEVKNPIVKSGTAKAGKRSAKSLAEKDAEQEKAKRKTAADEKPDAKKVAKKPPRRRAERKGKKYRELNKLIDKDKTYDLADSIDLALKSNPAKFAASVELHANLSIDPKKADQSVRDQLNLPSGTGKTVKVAVFADDEDSKKAKAAGADIVGSESIKSMLDKEDIKFDALIATPAMMASLGKYAKLLGPRGLMPNPKSGTVTNSPEKAVKEIKAGRVEYRNDSYGIIHIALGKTNMSSSQLIDNAQAALSSIRARRPASVKGSYIKSIYVTTSMGPSIKVKLDSR